MSPHPCVMLMSGTFSIMWILQFGLGRKIALIHEANSEKRMPIFVNDFLVNRAQMHEYAHLQTISVWKMCPFCW